MNDYPKDAASAPAKCPVCDYAEVDCRARKPWTCFGPGADDLASAPAGDGVGSIEWAREIAARFHEYSDPLDPSLREVARLTREGRYDTQDTVETVRFTAAALARPRAAVGEPFPQPQRRDGKPPCGECRLPVGETCDICGARQ